MLAAPRLARMEQVCAVATRLGHLEVAFTDEFTLRWNDKNSGAARDGGFLAFRYRRREFGHWAVWPAPITAIPTARWWRCACGRRRVVPRRWHRPRLVMETSPDTPASRCAPTAAATTPEPASFNGSRKTTTLLFALQAISDTDWNTKTHHDAAGC